MKKEDAHHKSSYADATIAARRKICLCGSSGRHPRGGLEQDLGGCKDDNAEKDIEQGQRGCGDAAAACRCLVRLSRDFWTDDRNGTREGMLDFVFRQLAAMTAWCRITTLELPDCEMVGEDSEILAGVLAQCPAQALLHLDLSYNKIGQYGLYYLPGLLQCTALTRLNLSHTRSGEGSAGAVPSAGAPRSQKQ